MWDNLTVLGLSNPVVRSVLTGVIRSVAGWVENSVKNGNWNFDFRLLLETLFRVLPQSLGLAATGLPPETALITDWAGLRLLKKK